MFSLKTMFSTEIRAQQNKNKLELVSEHET